MYYITGNYEYREDFIREIAKNSSVIKVNHDDYVYNLYNQIKLYFNGKNNNKNIEISFYTDSFNYNEIYDYSNLDCLSLASLAKSIGMNVKVNNKIIIPKKTFIYINTAKNDFEKMLLYQIKNLFIKHNLMSYSAKNPLETYKYILNN